MAYDLKKTQELFWSLTQARDGVQAACEPQTLRRWIVEQDPGEALARMEVYTQMYFSRISASLQEDFPAVSRALGEENFLSLVADYLQDHPSRFRDLAEVGNSLPKFLQTHPQSKNHPYLSDLARLEWAQIEVEREADAEPLGPAGLREIPAENWGDILLRLIPAARILRSRHRVLEAWKHSLKGSEGSEFILVWRNNFKVYSLEISEQEASLLEQIQSIKSFGELCASLAEREASTAAPQAASYLSQWLQRGILLRAAFKPALVVRQTEKGEGVFANRDFEPGDYITHFHGEIFGGGDDHPDLDAIVNHFIQIGVERYIGPSETPDNFINHSCDPNGAVRVRENEAQLIAVKKIKHGDEVTYDYSTTMVRDDWMMNCLCGSYLCRNEIKEFRQLPEEVKNRYIEMGIVPKYVLRHKE